MKTKKPDITPAERETLNIVATLVLNAPRGFYSETVIEQAREILGLDVERTLSSNTKRVLVARDGGDTLPPYDPAREQIVLAEGDLQMIETIRKRTKIIDTHAGPVPMVRLDGLPLKIASQVIDQSVRSHLRKVKDPSVKRGYRWEPRLSTEPFDEENEEHMAIPDNTMNHDLDELYEDLALLKEAEHPALRAMHRECTSDEPPKNWAELAARVHYTEPWLRKLIARERAKRLNVAR